MSDRSDELFQQVYRDHAGLLMRIARGFADNPADWDDLGQEILVALWRALPHYRAEAKLSTYVYRVAHSTALNWKRSRQRYARKLDGYAFEMPDAAASPREQERLDWLYACIRGFPPADRTLLLLHLDRVGYAEIAEITGLSESNIGVRLHRLKQQLAAQAERSL